MADLRDTLAGQQSGLEALVGKIPGYKGYKEKELRREADQKLRTHLPGQLAQQLSQAEDIASQMLTGPGLSQLDEMGKGNTRLQTLIDKVDLKVRPTDTRRGGPKGPPYGYAARRT